METAKDNGRPALDPVVLFKLSLLGYLYGVRSERQLMREVKVNVAYRGFLGLKLRDKVPDASTLSQFSAIQSSAVLEFEQHQSRRRNRFSGTSSARC